MNEQYVRDDRKVSALSARTHGVVLDEHRCSRGTIGMGGRPNDRPVARAVIPASSRPVSHLVADVRNRVVSNTSRTSSSRTNTKVRPCDALAVRTRADLLATSPCALEPGLPLRSPTSVRGRCPWLDGAAAVSRQITRARAVVESSRDLGERIFPFERNRGDPITARRNPLAGDPLPPRCDPEAARRARAQEMTAWIRFLSPSTSADCNCPTGS